MFGGRPLHLDHYALAAGEHGPVHLGDRPGRHRVGLDDGEDVLPRDAELLLHHRDDLGLAQRRHLILRLASSVDDRRAAAGRAGSTGSGRAWRTSGPSFFERRRGSRGRGRGGVSVRGAAIAEAVPGHHGAIRAARPRAGPLARPRPGVLPRLRTRVPRGVDDHDRALAPCATPGSGRSRAGTRCGRSCRGCRPRRGRASSLRRVPRRSSSAGSES